MDFLDITFIFLSLKSGTNRTKGKKTMTSAKIVRKLWKLDKLLTGDSI